MCHIPSGGVVVVMMVVLVVIVSGVVIVIVVVFASDLKHYFTVMPMSAMCSASKCRMLKSQDYVQKLA